MRRLLFSALVFIGLIIVILFLSTVILHGQEIDESPAPDPDTPMPYSLIQRYWAEVLHWRKTSQELIAENEKLKKQDERLATIETSLASIHYRLGTPDVSHDTTPALIAKFAAFSGALYGPLEPGHYRIVLSRGPERSDEVVELTITEPGTDLPDLPQEQNIPIRIDLADYMLSGDSSTGNGQGNEPDLYGPIGSEMIGFFAPGDWVQYEFTTRAPGHWMIHLPFGNPTGGAQVSISIDGGGNGMFDLLKTEDWDIPKRITINKTLAAGVHTIRITGTKGGENGWIGDLHPIILEPLQP
jgi:hypothetical protein